jgi:DNA-binding transcriptional ArsR family regulator
VLDVDVISEPTAAIAVLDPLRAKILSALAEPGSASTVAERLGIPRQQVNYHLRMLEEHHLVRLVEERPRRGLTERVMVATARSYVLSPDMLGDNAADPSRIDRLSARYLVALAARMVREVAELTRRADTARKPLATLAIDAEIRFGSPADRAAFTAELTQFVTSLAAKYHDEHASRGRQHRLVVAAHPIAPSAPRGPNNARQ